jgi:8-oxo-dGTP diphosphatase
LASSFSPIAASFSTASARRSKVARSASCWIASRAGVCKARSSGIRGCARFQSRGSLAPDLPEPVAGGDAANASCVEASEALGRDLPFDHAQILADGIERARAKLEYTPLATAFCAPEFTVGQLRAVYEAVWGEALDARNFHRKVTGAPGFIEPPGRNTNVDGGRPAQLYRPGTLAVLNPPIVRPEAG